ncbi:MAG: tRNA (adenosine(37)-N6)-threonylcarbamoyltransferase complex ATPase subunit type 1 TsaE [Bacteroidales bacterium]|nr:tRNA (adenosine(37)-N6)-threonylcarbamoyltransferase complex ATPase subunit type 1 TsaE [Bacteroidales bacterium]
MKNQILINSLSEIDTAAKQFLSELGDSRVVAFYGSMGAGKTTFITALCKALGVRDDAVSSPTFAIVNEYRSSSGESIFHFDFYRIERISEALDIGFYDYIDSGCLCLMEWPENIEDLLPEDCLRVHIDVLPEGGRVLSWEK